MLESPKSAILTFRFVSSKRFSGLRSLRTKNRMCSAVGNFCMELWMGEHWIIDGMDGIVLDSRWDGWDSIGY